jgi:hypothetical protein
MSQFEEKYKPINTRWITNHFNSAEFDSPDLPGSGCKMSSVFIQKLEELRTNCDFPFQINSGYRTEDHNELINGKKNSAHMLGLAADIHCIDSFQRYTLLKFALLCGFRRIGVYPTFIHLDIYSESPNPIIWMS